MSTKPYPEPTPGSTQNSDGGNKDMAGRKLIHQELATRHHDKMTYIKTSAVS